MNKILILGGSGFVGKNLFNRLGVDKAIATYSNRYFESGILFDALKSRVKDVLPKDEKISHAVILLGITNPNKCIADIEKSEAVNVAAIKRLIDDLLEIGIKPVFASTESVFDGRKGNYIESDIAKPVLTYGKQKIEIEQYLESKSEEFTILRFSNIVGEQLGDGTLFTNWITNIQQSNTIKCANDQRFSSVLIDDVVEAILSVIQLDLNGLFHVAGPEGLSRLQQLELLLKQYQKKYEVKMEIEPCSIHDFPTKEQRPLDVTMNSNKLIEATGLTFYHPSEICERIVSNIN